MNAWQSPVNSQTPRQTPENVVVLFDTGELSQGAGGLCCPVLRKISAKSQVSLSSADAYFASGVFIICCRVSLNVNYDGQGST